MATPETTQRLFFTFRPNGVLNGVRMAEATAERLEDHEPSADPDLAAKQSWFGPEDAIPAALEQLDVLTRDIDGVLSTLHVNKIATLELEVAPTALARAGFAPAP